MKQQTTAEQIAALAQRAVKHYFDASNNARSDGVMLHLPTVMAEFCEIEHAALVAENARLKAEKDKWRLAMESLTLQGSEFYNDVSNCIAYIQKKLDWGHEARKRVVKQQCEIDRLKTALEHYADPANWANVRNGKSGKPEFVATRYSPGGRDTDIDGSTYAQAALAQQDLD